jgi:hypothetical protein
LQPSTNIEIFPAVLLLKRGQFRIIFEATALKIDRQEDRRVKM